MSAVGIEITTGANFPSPVGPDIGETLEADAAAVEDQVRVSRLRTEIEVPGITSKRSLELMSLLLN